jgi:hypothetical protein
MPTPLWIGPEQRAALAALRELALAHPVEMRQVLELLKTRAGKAQHMRQMDKQSVEIPFGFLVTFSIELGHPAGTCRHMSMSAPNPERVPSPEGVWMVAELLGFVGDGIEDGTCTVWLEDLKQGRAVNLVQPVDIGAMGRA